MKKFWQWSKDEVFTDKSELILDGVIASESWWGDEITPKQFRDELSSHQGDLTVRINSPGGDLFAGLHIYNALKDHNGNVKVVVDALAASAASLVAMAGDTIVMAPGAMMMIHKPWLMVIGNSDDMEEAASFLKKAGDGLVPIYAKRTGLSEQQVSDMLDAETWMTASEAVDLGFADQAEEAKSTTSDIVKNALSYLAPVENAVMQPAMSLKKLIEVNNSKPETEADKDVADTVETPEKDVQQKKETVPAKAEKVKPSKEKAEPKDEKIIKPAKKETTTMDKDPKDTTAVEEKPKNTVEETAKDQIITPENQAKVEKVQTSSYLKSPKALEDYANVLAQNAGRPAQEVKQAWASFLDTKMGIVDNDNILLPPAIVEAIEDAFEKGGQIFNLLNKTGLDVYAAGRDTETGENSRAKGYNRADEDEKAEEQITLTARVLRPQFVYKYLTIPKEVIKENRSSGALLKYVLSELPNRIIREVERSVVIGDGRADNSPYKIDKFISIKDDAGDGVFANQYNPAVDETHYEALLRAKALVKADGVKYLVAKSDYLVDLAVEQGVNGGFLFPPGTDFARALGFGGIIEPDWMEEDTDNDAYIFVPSQYRTVGDSSIESFSNFVLKTNLNEYMQEIWAGGGLTALKSGVAITAEGSS